MLTDVLNDTMHEVWPRETAARHARLQVAWDQPHRDTYTLYAWRPQGDTIRWGRTEIPARDLVAGNVGKAMDDAITETLGLLAPLTTSEALEAGERRRGQG
jgi:hypothetical protein